VKTNIDCTRFDKFDEEEPFYPPEEKRGSRKQRKDINFVGYTYKRDVEDQKQKLVDALKETLNTDFNSNGPDVVATDEESIRKVPTNETTTSNFHSS
jgi:hypothetical protein